MATFPESPLSSTPADMPGSFEGGSSSSDLDDMNSPSSSRGTSPVRTSTGTGTGTSSGTTPGTMSGTTAGTTPGMSSPTGTQPDVLNRVVQGAHATIDRLAETAAPHVQRLQESMASAGDTLHARAGQVRDVGDEWAESLRTTVRENPLAAVATAVALGMLISRLTSHR